MILLGRRTELDARFDVSRLPSRFSAIPCHASTSCILLFYAIILSHYTYDDTNDNNRLAGTLKFPTGLVAHHMIPRGLLPPATDTYTFKTIN